MLVVVAVVFVVVVVVVVVVMAVVVVAFVAFVVVVLPLAGSAPDLTNDCPLSSNSCVLPGVFIGRRLPVLRIVQGGERDGQRCDCRLLLLWMRNDASSS